MLVGHADPDFLSASLLTGITWHPHTLVFTLSPPPFQLETSCFSPCISIQRFHLLLWAEMDASGSDVCIRSGRDETTLPSSPLLFLQPSSVHPATSIRLFQPHPHLPRGQFSSLTVGFKSAWEMASPRHLVVNLLIRSFFSL